MAARAPPRRAAAGAVGVGASLSAEIAASGNPWVPAPPPTSPDRGRSGRSQKSLSCRGSSRAPPRRAAAGGGRVGASLSAEIARAGDPLGASAPTRPPPTADGRGRSQKSLSCRGFLGQSSITVRPPAPVRRPARRRRGRRSAVAAHRAPRPRPAGPDHPAAQGGQLLVVPQAGPGHRLAQHAQRLVVDVQRHRERLPVLAALGQREARRVGEAARAYRAAPRPPRQRRSVRAPTPGVSSSSGKSRGPAPPPPASAPPSRRRSMSSARTSWWAGSRAQASRHSGRSQPRATTTSGQGQLHRAARAPRPSVKLRMTPGAPLDGGVGRVDEAAEPPPTASGSAGPAAARVHPLLHHRPGAVVATMRRAGTARSRPDGGAVHLGRQAAGAHQRRAVEAPRSPTRAQLVGRAARLAPAPPHTYKPSSRPPGASPRLSAPSTLVVIPEECQSIPITQPSDWNQKGLASRRSTSWRPYWRTSASTMPAPAAPSARPARPAPGRREAAAWPSRSGRPCAEASTTGATRWGCATPRSRPAPASACRGRWA